MERFGRSACLIHANGTRRRCERGQLCDTQWGDGGGGGASLPSRADDESMRPAKVAHGQRPCFEPVLGTSEGHGSPPPRASE